MAMTKIADLGQKNFVHSSVCMKSYSLLMILWILSILITISFVSGKPLDNLRPKRQSDQRIAELETLLALQKYGQHRLRDWGRREVAPGYGLIDFDKIGRRKKSTRFSPVGETEKVWSPWEVVSPPQGLSLDSARALDSNLGNIGSEVDQK